MRFPGQVYDATTGNHYNYFRDYDPKLGRYMQADPIGLNGGLNRYRYVFGNPLSLIDPLGLNTLAACGNPANAAACAEAGIGPSIPGAVLPFIPKKDDDEKTSAPPPGQCKDGDDCKKEMEACITLCKKAKFDNDLPNVWGGDRNKCLKGCLSKRCGGN
jgi:RHS repeat-associated protein